MMQRIWNRKSKPFYLRVLIYGGLFQMLLMCFLYSNPSRSIEQPIFHELDTTNNYLNICALPVYDYWHPDVMRIVRQGYDPISRCDRDFRMLTKLENGTWSHEEERNCSARCINGKGDRNVTFEEWMAPGPVSCEFLEAVCWENSQEVYGYIHTQIVKKPQTQPPKFESPPNVFVFMMDSMSTGQAKRSLPKTLSFLTSKLESVEFPFVNKVGKNSLPNGIALWTGRLIEPVNIEHLGGANIAPDWNKTEYCHSPMDNFTMFKEFREHGYMTLDIDDWADQMINYPNCVGFTDTPTHHYMHPFYVASEYRGAEITRKHLGGAQCREPHHPALEYFQQFAEAYRDLPKFSWMWLNSPAHTQFSGLIKMDSQILALFEKNLEMLENSFVFFMGDHGFRIGKQYFQDTPVGAMESSNPYLSISIPKKFRSDPKILETLRQNARKLQTHFDTRATMLDILKFQPPMSFGDRSLLEIPNEKGNSLLRRQPSFPRTCGRLPIPQDYCICQMEKVPVTDETLHNRYSQKLLEHIHSLLNSGGLSSKCEPFSVSHVASLRHFGHKNSENQRQNYEMTVHMEGPSLAVFRVTFVVESETKITFGGIERLDRYGDTGDCAGDGDLERLCYCRELSFRQKWSNRLRRVAEEWNSYFEGWLPSFLVPP